jgi:hypothetical protein
MCIGAALTVAVICTYGHFDGYVVYWNTEEGDRCIDTYRRFYPDTIERRVECKSGDLMTGIAKRLHVPHGHWKGHRANGEPWNKWMWYSKEITTKEWYWRDKLTQQGAATPPPEDKVELTP